MINYVVICTKERPSSLESLLGSINKNEFEISKIIVIDSSNEPNYKINSAVEKRIIYVHDSESNLIEAREKAVKVINGMPNNRESIVHFLDDDCILDDNYFIEISRVFQEYEAVGATGFNSQYASWPSLMKNLVKYFKYFKNRQGKILGFGLAIGCYEELGIKEVEWLPGFSMTLSNAVLQNIKFDKNLKKYNCIAEDLDLSIQASFYGKIFVNTSAKLSHVPSPINRNYKITKRLYRQIGSALYIYKKYFFLKKINK